MSDHAGEIDALVRSKPGILRRFFSALGPGVISGAADDDPSGIATYSIVGAQLGSSLLWTALITWPLMASVQFMCARIGMVTGMGLGDALRRKGPRSLLLFGAIALLVANSINVGADLIGMADAAEMLSGISSHIYVVLFGIAIALAAQNILGDLFSYFVIFFDKPFSIGDAISVNNVTGTVERIGIKTSHIRSVSGEQLIMPNAELVKSTIKNIKRLERRGVSFKLNVRYDTAKEKLTSIPEIIKQIINKQQHVTFDRCHLIALGDFSLTYEILYFIGSSDYKLYLEIQQNVYFEIINAFSSEGIDFAFPGQTIILQPPFDANKK